MSGLDELLAIVHSLPFEEHGKMRLLAVIIENTELRLQFRVDDGGEQVSEWELAFTGVDEVHLTTFHNCGLRVYREDHPALDQYTDPHDVLSFSAAAADANRVVGQLWAAHCRAADDWIPFDRYIHRAPDLGSLLSSRSGILAEGPRFLLEAYAAVLDENGCKPSTITGHERTGGACMVHFDESYVIAREVTCTRRSP